MAASLLPETQTLLETLSSTITDTHEWALQTVTKKTETIKLLVDANIRFRVTDALSETLSQLGYGCQERTQKDIKIKRDGTRTLYIRVKPKSVVNSAADLYEVGIVAGVNEVLNNTTIDDAITDQYKKKMSRVPVIKQQGIDLARKLIDICPEIVGASHFGKSDTDLTDKWKSFFDDPTKLDTTPKTDFLLYTSTEPLRVSLKKGKASQLMSGGKQEALASVLAISEITHTKDTEEFRKVLTGIQSFDSGKMEIEMGTLLRVKDEDDITPSRKQSASRKKEVGAPRRKRTPKSILT